MTKTNGQRLYEYKHPPFIAMVPYAGRQFATEFDIVMVKNESHTPWMFLTESCKASWERSAKGHHLFSNEAA